MVRTRRSPSPTLEDDSGGILGSLSSLPSLPSSDGGAAANASGAMNTAASQGSVRRSSIKKRGGATKKSAAAAAAQQSARAGTSGTGKRSADGGRVNSARKNRSSTAPTASASAHSSSNASGSGGVGARRSKALRTSIQENGADGSSSMSGRKIASEEAKSKKRKMAARPPRPAPSSVLVASASVAVTSALDGSKSDEAAPTEEIKIKQMVQKESESGSDSVAKSSEASIPSKSVTISREAGQREFRMEDGEGNGSTKESLDRTKNQDDTVGVTPQTKECTGDAQADSLVTHISSSDLGGKKATIPASTDLYAATSLGSKKISAQDEEEKVVDKSEDGAGLIGRVSSVGAAGVGNIGEDRSESKGGSGGSGTAPLATSSKLSSADSDAAEVDAKLLRLDTKPKIRAEVELVRSHSIRLPLDDEIKRSTSRMVRPPLIPPIPTSSRPSIPMVDTQALKRDAAAAPSGLMRIIGKPPTPRGRKPPTAPSSSLCSRPLVDIAEAATTTSSSSEGYSKTATANSSASTIAAPSPRTTSTKRSFLSGYDLDCAKTDILNLPDPPTPEEEDEEKQQRAKRRRRRMSTGTWEGARSAAAAAASDALGENEIDGGDPSRQPPQQRQVVAHRSDRKLRGDAPSFTANLDSIDGNRGRGAPRSIVFDDLPSSSSAMSSSSRRKVRNSLCHVPSPVEMVGAASNDVTASVAKSKSVILTDFSGKPPAVPMAKMNIIKIDKEAKSNEQGTPSPPKRGIVFDDDDEDTEEGNVDDENDDTNDSMRRRRKKKRQSIFLPSDMESASASLSMAGNTEETRGFYTDLLSYKDSATSHGSKSSAHSAMSLCSQSSDGGEEATRTFDVANPLHMDDPNTANIILQAVREVCSLPEEQRYASDQAGVIELLGGYPYVPPSEKERMQAAKKEGSKRSDLNWTFSPGSSGLEFQDSEKPTDDPPMSPIDPVVAAMERRRQLILGLGPVVERMEAKKKEETEAAFAATNCRVSRTRKGRYKYYDVEAEEDVRPKEYKRRYLAMIDRQREERMNRIGNAADENSAGTEKENEKKSGEEKISQQEDEENGNLEEKGLEEKGKESPLDEQAPDENGIPIDVGEDMDISLMSTVDSIENVEGSVLDDAIKSGDNIASAEEPETSDYIDTESAPINKKETEERFASLNDSSSSDFSLPIPDRDNPDEDPQIRAAEERLWADMDAALARYSREVISIRAARKMGFTLSQTADSP